MPTLKRGDLEKAVRNLGFSRRKARQAVQKTFQLMGKWLAKDRRLPLELGSGESKEVCGEFKVRRQLHKRRTIFRPGHANVLFSRHWQIIWEDCQDKKMVRAKPSKPSAPPIPKATRQQMPAAIRCLPPTALPWMPTSGSGRRTRF